MPAFQNAGVRVFQRYVYDDWRDNALSRRDPNVPPRSTPTMPYRMFRPVWFKESGSPDAVNQRLELDTTSGTHAIRKFTRKEYGTFETTMQFGTAPTSGNAAFGFNYSETNGDFWRVALFPGAGEARFQKKQSGTASTLISGTISDFTAENTLKVTRDASDTWELFINGTSQGTATDSFSVPNPVMRIYGANLDQVCRVLEAKAF